jgi:hypothetical protein
MSVRLLRETRAAVRHLNPNNVRQLADRAFQVGIVGSDANRLAAIEEFLAPPEISPAKRAELSEILHCSSDFSGPSPFDVTIRDESLPIRRGATPFYFGDPFRTVREVLRRREDLSLPLARHFPPFRRAVVFRIIRDVSRENAFFAVFAALPNILPSLVEFIWAPAEFASDSAFLTVNQIRMAFLIAAASDVEVGYGEQKAQIASIVAGAFGWRAIARELVGKIPLGGGLIPKGAIAYAGTQVVGRSLERFYRLGYGFSRAERETAFRQAYESGKRVVHALLGRQEPETDVRAAAS